MHIRPNGLLASVAALIALTFLFACGGGGEPDEARSPETRPAASEPAITEAQMVNGIGPITQVNLGPIDPEKVSKGAEVFQMKCSACHKLDERYVGPPLRGVLDRRTSEFALNMMLNSWEMTQKHPEVKKMLAEFYTPMPDQNLTEEDAFAVLDYLRQAAVDGPGN
jgi:mono/diheme cytochrome c family protein